MLNIFGLVLTSCVFHCGLGQHSHKELKADHYIDGHHNLEHDINTLLDPEDQDEIKKLSASEQKKRLEEIVEKIDTDSDKHLNPGTGQTGTKVDVDAEVACSDIGREIPLVHRQPRTLSEITLWIQKVYRKYALDDAKERFSEFDTDQDGVVSWDEYNMAMHDHIFQIDENTILEDTEEESLRYLHIKEKKRFNFADKDGTPGLNLTEFLAFTHPSEVDHMSDFAIEDVLTEYDSDHDGFISLKEFIGDIRPEGHDPSQWEIEETVRFKDLYDQDGDGKLNKDEQLRWVAPNSYGSAREEAIHLIKEMDLDGDGRLSQSEILKSQETFLNSEVTDYGRQLHELHDEL